MACISQDCDGDSNLFARSKSGIADIADIADMASVAYVACIGCMVVWLCCQCGADASTGCGGCIHGDMEVWRCRGMGYITIRSTIGSDAKGGNSLFI